MRFYSIIIPVYNRPDEIDELLHSLTLQTYKNFEVIVVEDGSKKDCAQVIEKYKNHFFKLFYYVKENTGQGLTRNFAYERANGEYFIVFDSDCIIPENYLESVERDLDQHHWDAFGGPDRAHESFTDIQKAISYSMTSPFTTGGIRGNKQHVGVYHPRSFNMGISRKVWEKTGGYIITRMGEDIEFSIRIIRSGFKVGLIQDAYVFHKRRTDFIQFFKQLHFFGRARINISRFYPEELKPVHMLPAIFVLIVVFFFFIGLNISLIGTLYSIGMVTLAMLLFLDASIKYQSIKIGCYSVLAGYIQLCAYGVGFIKEYISECFHPKKSTIQQKLKERLDWMKNR
jgi:glycosyltransferase involved in cell wall biosynthesis